jgi:hypothetical protein
VKAREQENMLSQRSSRGGDIMQTEAELLGITLNKQPCPVCARLRNLRSCFCTVRSSQIPTVAAQPGVSNNPGMRVVEIGHAINIADVDRVAALANQPR